MAQTIFEEMGGTYTQVGDYLLPNLELPEEEQQPIGVWGQRHRRYLKEHRQAAYATLLTSGKLNSYLADIDRQAAEMALLHGGGRLIDRCVRRDGHWVLGHAICYKHSESPSAIFLIRIHSPQSFEFLLCSEGKYKG